MAQTENRKLDRGDLFPQMELRLTDGSSLTIPDMEIGFWALLLVYRGCW